MQYRRSPLLSGYSPNELLDGRQTRTKLDAMVPSPAHVAQDIQARGSSHEISAKGAKTCMEVSTPIPKWSSKLCSVSWTMEGQGPQMGACHGHHGSWLKVCVCQGLPKRTCLA